MKNIKVFACNSAEEFTKEICDNLGIEMGKKDSFKFANDNTFVQIKETVREQDVYIVQTTQPPVNERIMELLITIEAAKRAGAKRITAVLPYFMYSRSDKKDQSRVPVTAKLMATILEAAGVNHVLTCDLHNPAIQAYFDVICDRDNKFKEAAFLQLETLELANNLFIETSPVPVKTALNMMGKNVGNTRLPLGAMENTTSNILKETLKKYKLI